MIFLSLAKIRVVRVYVKGITTIFFRRRFLLVHHQRRKNLALSGFVKRAFINAVTMKPMHSVWRVWMFVMKASEYAACEMSFFYSLKPKSAGYEILEGPSIRSKKLNGVR